MNDIENVNSFEPVNIGSNIRSLNWFLGAFGGYAKSLEPYVGKKFILNEDELRLVYFDWIALFESEQVKNYSREDYWDCVDYVAAMGLKGLIQRNPLRVSDETFVPSDEDPEVLAQRFGLNISNTDDLPDIVKFWPEGLIYVCYCISFISSLERQRKGQSRELNDLAFSLRGFWWSFRENAREDGSTILFFFDKILGKEPHSSLSDSLMSRKEQSKESHRLRTAELNAAISDDDVRNQDDKN